MTRDEIILEKIAAGERAETKSGVGIIFTRETRDQNQRAIMLYLSAIAHSLVEDD